MTDDDPAVRRGRRPEGGSLERFRAAAADLGLGGDVVELSDSARTAVDAANAVGCAVDQIAKSMIFEADGRLVLALTSGSNTVDPDKLAELASARRCRQASPDRVREITGFAIGGVAPFGHLTSVRCWIDPDLLTHDTVWVAAGTPHHVLAVPSDRLTDATAGVVADFVR